MGGEFTGEGDGDAFGGSDGVAICYVDGGTGSGVVQVEAMGCGVGGEVVAGGSGVEDGGVIRLKGRWD